MRQKALIDQFQLGTVPAQGLYGSHHAVPREMLHYTACVSLYFKITLLSWNDARSLAAPLRHSVFVEEQGVAEELEWDEFDAASIHAVAADHDGNILGTGRLLPADEFGTARIGRM